MYVIIAGGGTIGGGLARRLAEQNHDVVVIDRNEEVCRELYARYSVVSIPGDAREMEILESAGMERCDVAVAATREDADNLAFVLLARHFGVPQIVVRMTNPRYENVYKSVGVKNIARATNLLIDQLLVNIETPEIRKVIGLGDVEICIYDVPEDSPVAGRSVRDIAALDGFPEDVGVVCLFRDRTRSFAVARGNTLVEKKDRVFLCGTRADILKAVEVLRGG